MNHIEIAGLGMQDIARLIRERKLSALEAAQAMLERIERLDPGWHAFVRTSPELALAQARAADARQARGEELAPLHGVPIAVKDLCRTAGIPTTAGMTIHASFRPAVDATLVHKLRRSGTFFDSIFEAFQDDGDRRPWLLPQSSPFQALAGPIAHSRKANKTPHNPVC